VTPLIVATQALDIPGLQVIVDNQGLVAKRYDATPGTTYLLRPDQHVVARWRTLNANAVHAALARALCQPEVGSRGQA
jgi:3-(3-hydroxy-phenyl)propionate hydroxylase